MNRREFLEKATKVGGVALFPWVLLGCSGKPIDQGDTNGLIGLESGISLETSLVYLRGEIAKNSNIASLYEYGDERTMLFVVHAYNAYISLTQSKTELDELARVTTLGDNVAIQRIYDESVYGSQVVSAQDQLGKTYLLNPSLSAKTQRKGIMINRGAIGFNSRALTSSGGSHILTWLAETATHEPFHYDSKIVEIDELLKANSVYHYTHMSGFSMFGEKTNDGEKVINFGTLDELVTRYVHRKLIGSRMSDLSDNYGAGEIGWTDLVAREIFAPLGYTTPESILELQRGKGFVGLLNRLAKFRNGNKQAAYVELVDINNQLFSGTGGLS